MKSTEGWSSLTLPSLQQWYIIVQRILRAARWLSGKRCRLTARRLWVRVPVVPGPFCVEFACSPRACVGLLRVLRFPPPLIKTCTAASPRFVWTWMNVGGGRRGRRRWLAATLPSVCPTDVPYHHRYDCVYDYWALDCKATLRVLRSAL